MSNSAALIKALTDYEKFKFTVHIEPDGYTGLPLADLVGKDLMVVACDHDDTASSVTLTVVPGFVIEHIKLVAPDKPDWAANHSPEGTLSAGPVW